MFKIADEAKKNWEEVQNEENLELNEVENKIDSVIEKQKAKLLKNKAKPGDYVKYTVPEKEIILTTNQTGYNVDQIYNTSEYKGEWQVLYNDDEHGLRIISTDDITNGKKLYITGKEGYTEAKNTLNMFCENYINSDWAISGRCLGDDDKSSSTSKEELIENELLALKNAKSQNEDGLLKRERKLVKL